MASAPDDIRAQITATRASLDRHLDELGTQIDVTKERAKANAQYWGGVSAVAAGLIGAVIFWPRNGSRRQFAR
jgi:hypothetical protein